MKLKHLGFPLYYNDDKRDSRTSIKNNDKNKEKISKFDEILQKARETYTKKLENDFECIFCGNELQTEEEKLSRTCYKCVETGTF